MKYKRPQKTSLEIRESNRTKLLEALREKEELTFSEFNNLGIVSRGALNTHLKNLLKNEDIEKHYSKTKDRIVYRLTNQSEIELYVKSWIEYLGLIAITYIARKNTNKSINAKYDFLKKIETLLTPKKPKYLSWEQVLKYLEKDHWASVDLNKSET